MPKGFKMDLKDILIENSTYSNTHRLKSRLISEGYLVEKCCKCGIGNEWNGKPLSLQLDHKNGNNTDNRIENLRIMCPNCHSQTDTYASKNTTGKRAKKKEDKFCTCCGAKISNNNTKSSGLCRVCSKKNRRKVERPSIEILIEQIKEYGYAGTGRIYGVSDNTIRKWIKTS
ncbi:HNH endonuclease [Bacillus phage vB_BanS_Chewbecca]|uniref:HNH endonuclease n=1 Tax=Bacillus phage vB_BanS_Chewbecca TaxID=2894786 RepID=A0AAE9CB38_9CAUD|nr:HNH endonuclease [Bacillus phage vB_BanS_Chewbecca]UGO46293.1 HNH endonuclease [Bacillus phage vB_BanS_Chewbecca]